MHILNNALEVEPKIFPEFKLQIEKKKKISFIPFLLGVTVIIFIILKEGQGEPIFLGKRPSTFLK